MPRARRAGQRSRHSLHRAMLSTLFSVAFATTLNPDQALARKRVKADVEWAWDYKGPAESMPSDGRRYVGADLTLYRYRDALDLGAFEVWDPVNQRASGNPQYVCLGPMDMAAPCEGHGERVLRVRMVWAVAPSAESLVFSVWEKKLGKAKIVPIGPTLPRNRVVDGAP